MLALFNHLINGPLPIKDVCLIVLEYAHIFTGTLVLEIEHGGYRVHTLTALEDNKLATGTGQGTVRIWDLTSGKCLHTFSGFDHPIDLLCALGNNKLACCWRDGVVRVFDTQTEACLLRTDFPKCPRKILAYGNQMAVLMVNRDAFVVNEAGTCTQLRDWAVQAMVVMDNGQLVTGAWGIQLWNSNECVRTLRGHNYTVTALACFPNNLLLSGDNGGKIYLWDPATATCLQEFASGYLTVSIFTLIALPENKFACSHNLGLSIWDVESGSENIIDGMRGKHCIPLDLAVHSDGSLLSFAGPHGSIINMWSFGTCVARIEGKIFASSNKRLVVASGGVVDVYV